MGWRKRVSVMLGVQVNGSTIRFIYSTFLEPYLQRIRTILCSQKHLYYLGPQLIPMKTEDSATYT